MPANTGDARTPAPISKREARERAAALLKTGLEGSFADLKAAVKGARTELYRADRERSGGFVYTVLAWPDDGEERLPSPSWEAAARLALSLLAPVTIELPVEAGAHIWDIDREIRRLLEHLNDQHRTDFEVHTRLAGKDGGS